jgi:hypothetical protein
MHLWRRLIALSVLAAFALQAAVVYKWTDADGVVHFSDQPAPGAQKITTAPAAAVPPRPAGIAAGAVMPAKKLPAVRVAYDDFSIVSPLPEQTYFATAVNVQLHVSPQLDPNHAVSLQLNGAEVPNQPPDALSFTLELPRGAYSLVATITDKTSSESLSTDPVAFYVRQPSALAPQRK